MNLPIILTNVKNQTTIDSIYDRHREWLEDSFTKISINKTLRNLEHCPTLNARNTLHAVNLDH